MFVRGAGTRSLRGRTDNVLCDITKGPGYQKLLLPRTPSEKWSKQTKLRADLSQLLGSSPAARRHINRMEKHRRILHNTEPINPKRFRRLLRAQKKKRKKKKRSALPGRNHNEACELINASLMKCAAFRANLMTKGSRSLNGLFIAFDLFQTAAVKSIMFSHRRYGRGERTDRAGNNPQPPPKKKKISPRHRFE